MKTVLLLAGVVGLVAAEKLYYATGDDYLDIDAVIADLPALHSFVSCFLEREPCTSLTDSYRRHIQDSVVWACDRCNLPQKQRYAKLFWALRTKLPHDYIAFRQKYDPEGVYFEALEAELAKYLDDSSPVLFPYYL